MSNILNSDDFGLKIYNRFPPKYREDDAKVDFALQRYIQALSEGGFKYAIDEINGITNIIDPSKTDSKVLPILFKQYGLEIFNGIPETYLRYLLPKLGEAWTKKGSLSVVEFITSSLSGIKTTSETSYNVPPYYSHKDGVLKVFVQGGITKIGGYAFKDFTNLESLVLSDTLEKIGTFAFTNCTSLKDVYYLGSESQWNEITIGDFNQPLLDATIHFESFEQFLERPEGERGVCGKDITWAFFSENLELKGTGEMYDYDSDQNPIIDVKLDMDYNIGDYFPEASQFSRLLKNFVPYYCDLNLIYSYSFLENFRDNGDEKVMKLFCQEDGFIYDITDKKFDTGNIKPIDAENQKVVSTINDSVGLSLVSCSNSTTNTLGCILSKNFCTNALNSYDRITRKDGSTEIVY